VAQNGSQRTNPVAASVIAVNYEWEQLADRVYRCRLPFLDVTVGLVHGAAAVLLIDCGTTLAEAHGIAEDVRELTGADVTHLVMTHHHFDHILGSGGFPGAQTYAAAPVALALSSGVDTVRAYALQYGADPGDLDRAIAAVRVPDHVIENADIGLGDLSVDIDLGELSVRVEHVGRGHTDHDLIVVVPTSGPGPVVFCGDLIEESADPAIDDGSDVAAWPQTLERVLAMGGDGARYVPGHGAVVNAEFVRRQRDWLADRA
jgi:glyoxylase-like metal-dependent hydrolase (beta-lactamase superfamily II)